MFDPESAITIAKALKSIEPEIGGGLERLSQEALESLPHTVKLIIGADGKSLELPGSIAHLERVGEYATDRSRNTSDTACCSQEKFSRSA